MPEPFRDDTQAALSRVASLEDENAALRVQLSAKVAPPAEARAMPLWLVLLFVFVPIVLMGAGLCAAFLLRRHDPVVPVVM